MDVSFMQQQADFFLLVKFDLIFVFFAVWRGGCVHNSTISAMATNRVAQKACCYANPTVCPHIIVVVSSSSSAVPVLMPSINNFKHGPCLDTTNRQD